MDLIRRKFFFSVVGSLACLDVAKANQMAGYLNGQIPLSDSIEQRLETIFKYPENAREIGKIYLNQFPYHARRSFLLEQGGVNRAFDPIKSFEQKRAHDFRTGNTVNMDGWILAKAEVCVCALLAFSSN